MSLKRLTPFLKHFFTHARRFRKRSPHYFSWGRRDFFRVCLLEAVDTIVDTVLLRDLQTKQTRINRVNVQATAHRRSA